MGKSLVSGRNTMGFGIFFCLVCLITVTGTINPEPSSEGTRTIKNHRPCIPRDFGKGSVVCVCNSTYCDFPEPLQIPSTTNSPFSTSSSFSSPSFDEQLKRGLIQIYTSTKSGQRLHKSIHYFNNNNHNNFNNQNVPSYSSSRLSPPTTAYYSYSSGNNVMENNNNKNKNENDYYLSLSGGGEKSSKTIYDNDLDSSSTIFYPFSIQRPRFPRQSAAATNLQETIAQSLFGILRDAKNPQSQPPSQLPKYIVSPQQTYQQIIGFGGSFTDAAGINIGLLSKPAQQLLMKSYFGEEGNDYSLGRVPIGGTDFSTRAYTLNDVPFHDMNLTHFSLQPEDHKLKIPLIKWAESLMTDKKLRLLASPWSAPVWMKTNRKLNGFGFLRTQFYQVWADYFVKFVDSYRAQNVSIWGVTTGNEPLNGFIPEFPFNCMGWSPSNVQQWILNNLGPSLQRMNQRHRKENEKVKGGEHEDVKLIILDDNKFNLALWGRAILDDPSSSKYVQGVGTHWYFDFLSPSDILSQFHQRYPNYFIIQTEACLGEIILKDFIVMNENRQTGFTPWELEKVILGSFERGVKYLEAIINDMRNWVGGWIDWNLALNLSGGPNWAKWAADAAILVNAKEDEFFKQPIHYAIGHISKFVPPDSRRIEMSGTHVPRNLQSVAFLRPDNGTVLIFLNKHSYDIKISIYDERRGSTFLTIPAISMQTIVYW